MAAGRGPSGVRKPCAGWRRSTRSVRGLASARAQGFLLGRRETVARGGRFRRAAIGEPANERNFEELDFRPTPIGVLTLRRRRQLSTGIDIFEIKLGDEFLMSSLFTAAEIELARLGLAGLAQTSLKRTGLDVVVGGLGLGYTAQAVLEHDAVGSLIVVDALAEVIEWHEQELLPIGKQLNADSRCRLVHADFFAMTLSEQGYDPDAPGRRFDAVLVDIDHSPQKLLHPRHAGLYTPDGLARLAGHLRPGGVFALWSNDPPDQAFVAALANVFEKPVAHVVTFPDAQGDGEATNTVYVGVTPAH